MRLKDLYRTEIYDERRGTSFSPIVLLAVTLVYTAAVVSFDRYQTLRMLPLAAYPIFMGSFARVSGRDLLRKMLTVLPFVIFIGIWNPFFDSTRTEYLGIMIPMGWISFFSLILKFLLIVPATLIMVAVTGFDGLCRTAASLRLPEVLVVFPLLFPSTGVFVENFPNLESTSHTSLLSRSAWPQDSPLAERMERRALLPFPSFP